MHRLAIIALLSIALAGCESGIAAFEPAPIKPVVKMTGDTFCRQVETTDPTTGEKRFAVSWMATDSVRTAQEVENLAAKYARLCTKPKALSALK